MEKYGIMWKDSIATLLNPLKIKDKLHFTTLNYPLYYNLHHRLWSSIQVNHKLDIEVQSVIKIIF